MAETPSRRWAACAATPGHHALEGQRAGLRADDVEAGRLGDQARVEGGVALERGERAEAAVLLGGRPPRARPRPPRRRPAPPRPGRAARPPPRPSCRRCRGRRASRPPARPTTAPWRHGTVPSGTTSMWPLTARRPRRACAADARRSGPTARRAPPPRPGWSGCGAQRREVVLVQVGAQAERLGQLGRDARARRARRRSRSGPARARPRRAASARGVDHGVASSVRRLGVLGGLGLDAPHGVGERARVGDARRLDDVGRHRLAGAGGALAQRARRAGRRARRRWPRARRRPTTSPSASWPPVTASTRNSRRRASSPVAALMARKTASIGPSPVNAPWTTLARRACARRPWRAAAGARRPRRRTTPACRRRAPRAARR